MLRLIIILLAPFFIRQTNGVDFILEIRPKLPNYFPPRFRTLSWTGEDETRGGRVFYVEGSKIGKRFLLRANSTMLPTGKIIMIKSAKFYTEKGYEPEGWYYPGSDPEFTGTWISAKKGPIDSFSDKLPTAPASGFRFRPKFWLPASSASASDQKSLLPTSGSRKLCTYAKNAAGSGLPGSGTTRRICRIIRPRPGTIPGQIYIVLTHDQFNELTVFTSIHILLDPPPVKIDEINRPADFVRLGFTFTTQDAEIRNVSSGA
ncbi:hypothetical protein Fcan01_24067 [Folsomia candida]|uniref:Uncharacterized protein n=1 Tax=Folsomia candida TaxID=158441 RepID=A0A226D8X0_FOLCA|nr:hypothetical protein Fcan01_24067 [Folsomia candida]